MARFKICFASSAMAAAITPIFAKTKRQPDAIPETLLFVTNSRLCGLTWKYHIRDLRSFQHQTQHTKTSKALVPCKHLPNGAQAIIKHATWHGGGLLVLHAEARAIKTNSPVMCAACLEIASTSYCLPVYAAHATYRMDANDGRSHVVTMFCAGGGENKGAISLSLAQLLKIIIMTSSQDQTSLE